MTTRASRFAGELRRELCARNAVFAESRGLAHVPSYGEMPVTVYAPEADGRRHGNFYPPSYRAILQRQEWARRLEKVHSGARSSLPRAERRWRELDSCTSSDALLMSIFCCPSVCANKSIMGLLGTEPGVVPEFGYRACVPLRPRPCCGGAHVSATKPETHRFDRTEIDMKLGDLLVESKLTETDLQADPESLVASYRDLEEVFDVDSLPRSGRDFHSYQLIRNVLAAYALNASSV